MRGAWEFHVDRLPRSSSSVFFFPLEVKLAQRENRASQNLPSAFLLPLPPSVPTQIPASQLLFLSILYSSSFPSCLYLCFSFLPSPFSSRFFASFLSIAVLLSSPLSIIPTSSFLIFSLLLSPFLSASSFPFLTIP